MRRTTKLYAAGILVTNIGLLSGCGYGLESQTPSSVLHDDQAQALMKSGNFAGAAEEYLRLGQQLDATQSYPYRIYAAEAYLEAKQPDRAESVLAYTTVPARDVRFSSWQQLLKGRIALAHNDLAGARANLVPINSKSLPLTLQSQVLRTRAAMFDRLGEDLNALQNYVELDALLTDPKVQTQVRHASWEAAVRAANKGNGPTTDNAQVNAWLDLAQVVQTQQRDRTGLDAGLRDWQQRFPGHPANSILATISAAPLKPDPGKHVNDDRIALLLPLSGQFANAGAAIRDGIIAAWYEDNDVTQKTQPKISVYDVSAKNVVNEYKRAVTDGASAVIGPLEKPAVNALMNANVISVKTVVLNQTDNASPDPSAKRESHDAYEFSLAPEDEAEQVAERAWFDGHAKAYVLSPTTSWGERVRSAFRRHFEQLGGTIVGSRQYRGSETEGTAKEVDDDGQGGAEHPRTETDSNDNPAAMGADFVFLGAFPSQGRQLARDLASHGTAVPVYATSHIFGGKTATDDRDLQGVVFCDMPWVIDSAHQSTHLATTIKQTWPKAADTYGRLFALGIDAYHLLPYLTDLRGQLSARFEGETGMLSIDGNGRIRRQLSWAKYADGRPNTLESAALP
jgi:uncharacterized protein